MLSCGLLLVQVASSSGASASHEGGHSDATALVQHALELRAATGEHAAQKGSLEAVEGVQGRLASLETVQVVETALYGLGSRFAHELKSFEEEQEGELQSVREVHAYIEQLQVHLGRRGTFFGDMMGLAPIGHMSEEDEKMMARLLLPFRSNAFVKSVATGLNKLANLAPTLVWRSEKHVADLIRKSSTSSVEEIQRFLVELVQKEHHLMKELLDTVDNALKDIIDKVPGRAFVKAVWSDLLGALMKKARTSLDDTMKSIPEKDFSKFCGKGALDVFLIEQVLPALNSTATALPQIGTFAAAKVPDVAPQVSEAANWLREIVSNFVASIDVKAGVWSEKVCGLVGATAVS